MWGAMQGRTDKGGTFTTLGYGFRSNFYHGLGLPRCVLRRYETPSSPKSCPCGNQIAVSFVIPEWNSPAAIYHIQITAEVQFTRITLESEKLSKQIGAFPHRRELTLNENMHLEENISKIIELAYAIRVAQKYKKFRDSSTEWRYCKIPDKCRKWSWWCW
jgi:hypothetical protein